MTEQDGRKLDHKSLGTLRISAVRRVVENRETPSEAMRSLGLCRTLIYPWLRAHKCEGPQVLLMRKASGPLIFSTTNLNSFFSSRVHS
jgi:hypothetical protein